MSRRQARRGQRPGGGPAWFMAGLVCGLGLAAVAWVGGYLPRHDPAQPGTPSGRDEPPIAETEEPVRGRQFDFFTVLPEIEVVVPRQEIEERARERTETAERRGPYVLQVGSFRAAGDAEALRAQLALLGVVAQVHQVTVNDATWHRVRVGPFDNAREADGTRRRLQDNGYETMVLSSGG